jgi:hypothetical protein
MLGAERNKELAEKAMLGAVRDKEMMERDQSSAERTKELAELVDLQVQKEMLDAQQQEQLSGKSRMKMEQDMIQVKQRQDQMLRDIGQAKLDLQRAILERELAERDQKLAAENLFATQKLITELVKDGLAKDEKSVLSVKLNKDEFILNGKRQSDAIHKKYAAKYLVKPGVSISFHKEQ